MLIKKIFLISLIDDRREVLILWLCLTMNLWDKLEIFTEEMIGSLGFASE